MLEGILSDVVLEFFDSYGVPCSPRRALDAESGEAGTELGSMISIRGGKTHGGLAFVAPMGLVASLIPVPHRSESPEMAARDWCLEMANQLLGRLKNKLAAYSLTFDIGTPVCFSGRSIRLVFLPDAEGVALTFIVASHEFRVYLDWSFETGALPVKSGRIRIAAEGEVFLF
jgi:hypothetical protein